VVSTARLMPDEHHNSPTARSAAAEIHSWVEQQISPLGAHVVTNVADAASSRTHLKPRSPSISTAETCLFLPLRVSFFNVCGVVQVHMHPYILYAVSQPCMACIPAKHQDFSRVQEDHKR
jgi:hypothetical protein